MIPDINLLPVLDKRQKTSNVFYILLGVVALLALAFLVWQYFSVKSSIATLKNEETVLMQQRDQLQTELNASIITQEKSSLGEMVEIVDTISYPVLPLVVEIEGLRLNNTYLRSYSFNADSVSLTVDFETLSDISDYIARLTNSDFFVDAQISNITSFELDANTSGEIVEEVVIAEDFDAIPRRTAYFTLLIDEGYLATGGGN